LDKVTAANTVDHITPHRGDDRLFWDRENLQALCPTCHSAIKQREEARGFSDVLDADGWPADARHPANAGGERA
jgi:5-methylcytosine-specific restriction endonuclease McrA